ncbi:MAG: iron-sulfur cluster assembly scaffold protein [Chloroflexi bacterium RBG_13_56_8]|nr:MAG: iron-sulfur cluster assembly scaffold protein [Chloroflexi bacterium RBG_13_56_8]
MPLPYSDKVMEHFRHPRNVGRMEDPDAKAIEGSPACGDMVAVYLKVDEESKRIDDIKFESYGCASNIATGSIITELAKGKTLDEAKEITWQQASDALGGLPPIKTHCSILAVDGLRSAIQNYEERHGLVVEKVPTTLEEVQRRLRRVMNPVVGVDIVRSKLTKEVELNDGVVRVVVDLPADHQFAASIREGITEKIEPLWDIKEVIVEFTE